MGKKEKKGLGWGQIHRERKGSGGVVSPTNWNLPFFFFYTALLKKRGGKKKKKDGKPKREGTHRVGLFGMRLLSPHRRRCFPRPNVRGKGKARRGTERQIPKTIIPEGL